jgi:hypothetical protein
MATRTATIYASASAYVTTDSPNSGDHSKAIAKIIHNRDTDQSLGYEMFAPPKETIGKRFVSGILYVYGKIYTITSPGRNPISAIIGPWDPKKTTWNDRPQISAQNLGISFRQSSFDWASCEILNKDAVFGAAIVSYGFELNAERGAKDYYTSNSDKKPYIEFTYADDNAGLYPTDLRPANEFADNRAGVELRWSIALKAGTIGRPAQTKAVVSWTYGSTTKTATVNGAAQSYTIPASQLPETGTVTWRITTTDSAGNTYTSPDATFTTTDATCTAWPVTPVNAYVDGSKTVTLVWGRSISTGSAANGADFQASGDGGITWTTLGRTTGYADFQAAPGALPAGNVLWRVRGYNTDGVAGPWSAPANIVVRQAPRTPSITRATMVPRPTITWQAEGQQAYQLQVGSWESGSVYGTAKSAQVPVFLPDGPAAVRLRVQNSFGLWSQWATTSVTIANKPGAAITLQAREALGGVCLTWETQGNYSQYIIYRNGKEVGSAAGKAYTDYTSPAGKASYVVRGVNADSTYTDSSREVAILIISSGMLAEAGVWEWVILSKRLNSRPARSHSEDEDMTLTWYSGRTLPVAELSGKRSHTASYAYSLSSWDQVERIRAMEGKQVVYKHKNGELMTGILGGLSWSCSRRWWDVSFTITEVDNGLAV